MRKILGGGLALLVILWAVLFLGYLPSQLMKAEGPSFINTPDSVGLEFDDVSIPLTDEDLTLSAWWMPAEDAKATILFVHGANANKEDFYFGALDFYKAMVARNVNVLGVDLRNHGGSAKTESGNLAYGAEEYRDIIAALTLIETQSPDLPVYGIGVSMGGATLIEAASHDAPLNALILVDPLLDPASATLAGMQAITGLPAALLRPTVWSATTFFGLGETDPSLSEKIGRLSLPILLIQDIDDPVTQASFARAAASANDNISYVEMPAVAADHPVLIEAEGWGTHATAYRVYPEQVLAEIERVLP
ncbi:MAG: alpha/beta fold hydrolase [Parvibaculum sp.]